MFSGEQYVFSYRLPITTNLQQTTKSTLQQMLYNKVYDMECVMYAQTKTGSHQPADATMRNQMKN